MLNITLLGPFYILGGDYTPRPISGSTHSKESSPRDQLLEGKKLTATLGPLALTFPAASRAYRPSFYFRWATLGWSGSCLESGPHSSFRIAPVREGWDRHRLGAAFACPRNF